APSNDVVIAPYLPSGTDANEGFARYHLPADHRYYFRYWFKWDTRAYASSRTGPRSFTNSVTGFSGLTTNYVFTFGPKILGGVNQIASQQYQFTNAAYLGTNVLANPSQQDPDFSQPDQYKLQVIQPNGEPLPGVTGWTDGGYPIPVDSDGQYYTAIQYVHTNR